MLNYIYKPIWGIWEVKIRLGKDNVPLSGGLFSLLYKMPSNLKGKNFVSKIPGYCHQNTMAFFFIKIRWHQDIDFAGNTCRI